MYHVTCGAGGRAGAGRGCWRVESRQQSTHNTTWHSLSMWVQPLSVLSHLRVNLCH